MLLPEIFHWSVALSAQIAAYAAFWRQLPLPLACSRGAFVCAQSLHLRGKQLAAVRKQADTLLRMRAEHAHVRALRKGAAQDERVRALLLRHLLLCCLPKASMASAQGILQGAS